MPTANEILLELYRTQAKILEHKEAMEKYRLKEAILLDDIRARAIDIDKEMPTALAWFMESF